MPEKAKPQGTLDPTWFWKQWQDTTSNIWANVLEGSTGASSDPFGLYRTWLKSITEMPSQAQAITSMADPKEGWRHWFEYTQEAWKKVAGLGADPLGLTTRWVELLEKAHTRMLAGETTPADTFAFFKQWYDATYEGWAKEVGNLFASDQFMEAVSHFLESYAGFTKQSRRANEEFFRSLQLPTRSDIARVAELVIAVEEKVDRLDDAFADFMETATQGPGDEALSAFQAHLAQVESTTTFLPLALGKLQVRDGLSQRLDQLERKLDVVLSAIQRTERKTLPMPDASAVAAPRRSVQKTSARSPAAPAAEKK